jgi:hypothetical protein
MTLFSIEFFWQGYQNKVKFNQTHLLIIKTIFITKAKRSKEHIQTHGVSFSFVNYLSLWSSDNIQICLNHSLYDVI